MDKFREAFEKKFPIPAHWIEFDEKRNKYYCPYVADAKAFEYQEMWEVWQSRQAEVDALKNLLEKDEYAHNLYYENANLQMLVEEKDKRIETALAIASKMAKATNSTAMWAYDLEKALRGEHE